MLLGDLPPIPAPKPKAVRVEGEPNKVIHDVILNGPRMGKKEKKQTLIYTHKENILFSEEEEERVRDSLKAGSATLGHARMC